MEMEILPLPPFSYFADGIYRYCWNDKRGRNVPGYSNEENVLFTCFITRALQLARYYKIRLIVQMDEFGNLYLTFQKTPKVKTIFGGSHLDSVPNGGRYDGVDGCLCKMKIIRDWLQSDIDSCNMGLVLWRAEESPYNGIGCLGSKLAFGKTTLEELKDKKFYPPHPKVGTKILIVMGKCLEDFRKKLKTTNLNIEEIDRSKREKLWSNIVLFTEEHIAQARTLSKAGYSTGIVKAIRGNVRIREITYQTEVVQSSKHPKHKSKKYKISFKGEKGHTGAVAQKDRRDAVLRCFELVSKLTEKIPNIKIFVQRLKTTNDVSTAIPEDCKFEFVLEGSAEDITSCQKIIDDFVKKETGKVVETEENVKGYNRNNGSEFIQKCNAFIERLEQEVSDQDFVYTFPIINFDGKQFTFSAEVRSIEPRVLTIASNLYTEIFQINKGQITRTEPSTLMKGDEMQKLFDYEEKEWQQVLCPFPRISGAGHDIAIVTGPFPRLLFFSAQPDDERGVSHTQEEYRTPLAHATTVGIVSLTTRAIMLNLQYHKSLDPLNLQPRLRKHLSTAISDLTKTLGQLPTECRSDLDNLKLEDIYYNITQKVVADFEKEYRAMLVSLSLSRYFIRSRL
ncbi:hypothetical protein ACFL0U_01025 [Pseudomonadota bacterium]